MVNTQAALVVNAGAAGADTGANEAFGNNSDVLPQQQTEQVVQIGSEATGPGLATTIAGLAIIGSNTLEGSNTSDGSASITTGDATATGNHSDTAVSQTEDGSIDGIGFAVNTQAALVLNVGAAGAITGGNEATGNDSFSVAGLSQNANLGTQNGGDAVVAAPQVLASNSGTIGNASDGSARIVTGDAAAVGNVSSTHLDQVTGAAISGAGFVLDTQVATVANVGLAGANTGFNFATGNGSSNDAASVSQRASIGSGNTGDVDVVAALPLAATNSGSATNGSDGSAEIATGDAWANGNRSATHLSQDPESSVTGLGGLIGTQVAGVANVGVGVANSGVNVAIGNDSGNQDLGSPNDVGVDQEASVGADNQNGVDDLTIAALGPLAASNTATAANSSDGHAKVKTGNAVASGNASTTTLRQGLVSSVDDAGLVIGTQVGGVANIGIGVANTGANRAVGNESSNAISPAPDFTDGVVQSATISSGPANPDPSDITALGPIVASNSADASNSSDGEACVCTGDATASGNESTTDLVQDLDLSTGGGVVLLTQAGGVLNLGVGIANSGLNEAIGNSSMNFANAGQSSNIDDAIDGLPLVGPQIASNGVTGSNSSDGTALVASGNATGIGNQSDTTFGQEADVDSALAISTIAGGTTNAGLGLANAGLNRGVGNDSVNRAELEQIADGSGIVSNQGEASNVSDGTAIIGDPSKCDDVPETEKTPGLPRTGGPLEVEAAVALMLLLAGFGLRRTARHLA